LVTDRQNPGQIIEHRTDLDRPQSVLAPSPTLD